jgi:hypothetical protein
VLGGIFTFYIYNQNQQLPTKEDVFISTENWSPEITNVYVVKNINDEWISIFRSDRTLFLGRLEQNGFGTWELEKGSLGDEPFYPNENNGVIWSGSENSGNSFYFGMISNPEIQKVIMKVKNQVYSDIDIFETDGERFFYLKRKGEAVPYSFKALDKEGNVVISD